DYHGYIGASGRRAGGTAAGARNVISGNGGAGIHSFSNRVKIQGNYIGVGADGLTRVGNVRGIFVDNPTGGGPITVGGGAAAARNVISGNTGYGTAVFSAAAGALVQGNYIGTDATGGLAVGN